MKVSTLKSAITEQMLTLENVRSIMGNLSTEIPIDKTRSSNSFKEAEVMIQHVINQLYTIMTLAENDGIEPQCEKKIDELYEKALDGIRRRAE